VIIVSASGGARMYEGMLSLMQMAKTCGALGVARGSAPAIHLGAYASNDGRSQRELCDDWRRDHRGTEGHDRPSPDRA
jgi:hypothetical protein